MREAAIELLSVSLPVSLHAHEPVVIAPLGDIQWNGAKGPTAIDTLQRHLDKAMKLNAWFIGLGDYIDFMSPSNRQRLTGAALYDEALNSIDDRALDLVLELYQRFLKPTKGRWLGMLHGHHYSQLQTGETSDQRLCQLLETRFLGTSAYVRIQFTRPHKGKGRSNVVLWAHHGCGGGMTAGAPLNKLEQMASAFPAADVYIMGHTCLTTRARIMTRSGFKHHTEVLIGEDVLAYDITSGLCRWTPLLNVTTYPDAPMLRVTSKSFLAEMTPYHQWVMENWNGDEGLRTLEESKPYHGIVTARPAEDGVSPLTPRDAAILGWLVTDGCILIKPGRLDGRIIQKKPKFVAELRALLGADAREYSRKTGQTEFYLRVGFLRPLLERAGFDRKDDLPRIVSSLSRDARAAMLDAYLKAEGDGARTFNQAPGPVWDSFLMLTALLGRRVGLRRQAYDHTKPVYFGKRQIKPSGPVWRAKLLTRHSGPVTVAYLKTAPIEPGVVWCPTTQYGTWVAELDGQTFITGNTKKPAVPIPRVIPRWHGHGAPDLVERTAYLVNSGGFSVGWAKGSRHGRVPMGGYVEQRMLKPTALGAPFIRIVPQLKYTDRTRARNGAGDWSPEISVEI